VSALDTRFKVSYHLNFPSQKLFKSNCRNHPCTWDSQPRLWTTAKIGIAARWCEGCSEGGSTGIQRNCYTASMVHRSWNTEVL